MQLSEGSLVSCISKIKVEEPVVRNGTVWMLTGTNAYILDELGYIHEIGKGEVYPPQKSE